MEMESRGLFCERPISQLSLHSEVGIGSGNGDVAAALAVRTGLSSNRGDLGASLSFVCEQEVRLQGGAGMGERLLERFSPTEGSFQNGWVGVGGGGGTRM